MTALEKLSKSSKVTLAWMPRHQRIDSNEVADGLAREGSNRGAVERAVGLPFATGKTTIKRLMDQEHQFRRKKCSSCRRSKFLMKKPTHSRAMELIEMSRQRFGTTIGLLTEYVILKAHLFKLKIINDNVCRLCGYSGEDSVHILCRCPALACKKYLL